jgi:radical SAM-linked protein
VKLRVRFAKQGKVRWTSHRDVARMWERALRRVQLPVAYSAGFSPRPRLSFGLALSTGHESLAEYLDVDLAHDVGLDGLPGLLTPALPVGIDVTAVAPLGAGATSLQQDVTSCSWRITAIGADMATAAASVDGLLGASEVVVTRSRKGHESQDDIRPAVLSLTVVGPVVADDGMPGVVLLADLAAQGRALRPGELLAALWPGAEERRVVRTHQWIERDGARHEPLVPDEPAPPHAERACA